MADTGQPITVVLYQEVAPARQWVVELHKPGGRMTFYRGISLGRERALAIAQELAQFLGAPLSLPPVQSSAPSGAVP